MTAGEAVRTRTRACLALVVVLAAAPRVAWYRWHQPELPPDTYGYLNVARELRGERAPAGKWDDRSDLPWANEAARTPTYPLFLNLVFMASGRSPTPEAALAGPRRILRLGDPQGVRPVHLRHLETDENVRAVQAVQHGLGVAATAVAFLTLLDWTGSTAAATIGSLVAVGWNPVWIATYEPSVLTEVPSGLLLMIAVWQASRRRSSRLSDHVAAAFCGVAMTIRPPMIVSTAPILAYLIWKRRQLGLRAMAPLTIPLVMVALVVANNGLRYGYWGFASAGGGTLMSHAAQHPEGLRPPFNAFADRIRGNRDGGQLLLYVLSVEQHVPYLVASKEIQRAAAAFAVDHPRWFLASVAGALAEFCSPPFRLVPAEFNVLRLRYPRLWLALSGAMTLVLVVGAASPLVRVAPPIKLGALVYLVSAVGIALVAHTENKRFAAPTVPLVLMSGVATLSYGTAAVRSRGHAA